MKYICKECSEERGRHFSPLVVNEVGRKSCSLCGGNEDWRMDALSEAEEEKLFPESSP